MENYRSKKMLRKKIRELFALDSFLENIESNSKIISGKIVESFFYKNSSLLMGYMALNDEVDIRAVLLKAFDDEKKVFLPKCEGDGIVGYSVGDLKESLSLGYMGILEPVTHETVDDFDLVFVPGRAFDVSCNRLGRGKGFYDRFLAKKPSLCKVGVAFDFQIVNRIETTKNDVFMDYVITEKRILIRNKN